MAMQRDGWWLASTPSTGKRLIQGQEQMWLRPLLLIALIALGDALLWNVAAGLSLAVFAVALIMAGVLVIDPMLNRRKLALVGMGTLLSVLPVVELVQPLSVLLLCAGLSVVLATVAGLKPDRLLIGALRLWWVGPAQNIRDVWGQMSAPTVPMLQSGALRRLLIGWGVPIVLGLVFLGLFSGANPVLSNWIESLIPTKSPEVEGARLMFWGVIAFVSWPCLILYRLRERLRRTRHTVRAPRSYAVVNAASIGRSLVIFNVMFAAQTLMDIYFLYGIGELPAGMSYATYAHRGAYPLLATALLAGVFALVSRLFTKDAPMLRMLLLLWVAQTLMLVLASIVRTDLYIAVYELTHWRIAALIWMGLVAAGLCVTWAQIWMDKPNSWMLLRVGALGAVVLYVCAFTSFDGIVVRYNLTHDARSDTYHICRLGEGAHLEVQRITGRSFQDYCLTYSYLDLQQVFAPKDWREWGFRNWRVRRSLQAMTAQASQL